MPEKKKKRKPPVGKNKKVHVQPTIKLCEELIQSIEEDSVSFSTAAKRLDLNVSSAWEFIHRNKGLDEKYARAREVRGYGIGEQVVQVGTACLQGKFKPDVARVAIDAYKWAAARMAPKHFGNKPVISDPGDNQLDALAEALRRGPIKKDETVESKVIFYMPKNGRE
jgi:hypothetical protein